MSIRANPTAIGLFMVGATAVTLASVALMASNGWLEDRSTFVSYFGESVNGLERGAAVKFQGVPVGTVTELLIQIDRSDKSFQVPVRYEVDLTRLTTEMGTFVRLDDPQVLEAQIRDGLRAQLQMESVVTGQLYIELTYRPDDEEMPELEARPTTYPEIPTTPSLLAAFGTEAGSLVSDVLRVLFRVNEMLEQVDVEGISTSVMASAQSVERLVGSEELRLALGEVPELSEKINQTMTGLQLLAERLGATIDPMQSRMEATSEEVTLTLQATRQAIEEVRGLLTPDSGIGYQMEQTLTSLGDAAEALRVFAIALERSPDMLIRGPSPPDER